MTQCQQDVGLRVKLENTVRSTAKTRPSRLVAAPQVTFLHIVVEGYWTVAPPITQYSTTHDAYMCDMRPFFHAPGQLAATREQLYA